MADTSVFKRLRRLFSTQAVVRNIGGKKLKVVEAGAQGEHKIQRGYVPEKTWSIHWIKNKQFSEAIEKFLDQEAKQLNIHKENLEQFIPYKSLY